jgi:hypothetical protein
MNLSPTKYSDLLRRIEELTSQVASLFVLVGSKATARDPSIAAFCQRKGISRSSYERLRKRGLGPKEMASSLHRVIITPEAEAEWDQARQAAVITEAAQRGVYRSRPQMDAAE